PPFPVEAGLWGKPTVINNVETLFAVPSIVARGGAWFAGLGGGRGTKLFGLSGHVRRPGVVEMELGCTLRTLIDTVGGGSSTGRPIRAAVVGGPSGSVVNPRHFDEPLIPRGPGGFGGPEARDEALERRPEGRAPPGRHRPRRREPPGDPAAAALQGSRPAAARRVPDLPRPRRGPARAAGLLPPARARRHGHLHGGPRRDPRAKSRARPDALDADGIGRAQR